MTNASTEMDRLRECLQKRYKLGEPATEAQIADFERRYGVVLPADVKEYFLKINGVFYSEGWSEIEPLDQWCLFTEYEWYDSQIVHDMLDEPNKYFRIGHYDIFVWDWLIKLDSDPNSPAAIFVCQKCVQKVTENLTEFLVRSCNEYSESLLGGWDC